jgi:hypothetical protein
MVQTELLNEISSPSTSFTMAGDENSSGYLDMHLGCISLNWLPNCEHDSIRSIRLGFDIGGLLSEREDADGLWGYVTRSANLSSPEDVVGFSDLTGAYIGYDGIGWGSGATSQDRIWYNGPVSYEIDTEGLSRQEIENLRFNFLWSDDHYGVPIHDVYVNNIRAEVEYENSGSCSNVDVQVSSTVSPPRTGLAEVSSAPILLVTTLFGILLAGYGLHAKYR